MKYRFIIDLYINTESLKSSPIFSHIQDVLLQRIQDILLQGLSSNWNKWIKSLHIWEPDMSNPKVITAMRMLEEACVTSVQNEIESLSNTQV